MKSLITLSLLILVTACSHSQLTGPHEDKDGRVLHTYTGRANFFWQHTTAKTMMQEKCDEINPGSKPFEYETEEFSLGMVNFGGSKSKMDCNISQKDYFGRQTASCSESGGSAPMQMDNRQMIVIFACEK